MQRKTLQKVIDELGKDSPNIAYIKGILETVMDTLPEEMPSSSVITIGRRTDDPQAEMLDGIAKARVDMIKNSADIQTT